MHRILLAALSLAACVAAGQPSPAGEEPVTIPVIPIPSGGAPMYFPDFDDGYVGIPELRSISEGVSFGGRLWLAGGVLATLDPADGRWSVLGRGIEQIAKAGDVLWLARSVPPWSYEHPDRARQIVLTRRDLAGAETALPPIDLDPDDRLAAIVPMPDGVLVLLGGSILVWSDADPAWRETMLRGPVELGRVKAALASTGELYVGYDRGEFGGGALRIDRATGAIVDLCRTPEGMCGNVSDMLADPGQPGCVIVSEGLAHMTMVEGRLVRLCRDRTEVLLRHRMAREQPAIGEGYVGAQGTEGFWDLEITGDGTIWASGMGAVYRLGAGAPERFPLSRLEPLHGLYVVRDFPGLLVVFGGNASASCGPGIGPGLPEGSPPKPHPDDCAYEMWTWAPMLIALG